MLAAAPPAVPPPVLVAPAPDEASFGRIAGLAPEGARHVAVRVAGKLLVVRPLRRRRFDFAVSLPLREVTVQVSAGTRSWIVPHVLGLPRAAVPRPVSSRNDPALGRRLRALAHGFPGSSGVFVQNLQAGAGASWNARARFPAASTLKLAIAVETLRTIGGKPVPGSSADQLLRAMLVRSDNDAANRLEVFLAGSTSAGGHRVNALLRSLGAVDSDMYGGYLRTPAGRVPIPSRVESQPGLARGKYTTAADLARLLTLVHLAAGGRGLLVERYRGSFTPAGARYLLYLLAHVTDRGKLDRFLPASALVLHKAGWISGARHDAGLVYTRGGVYVVVVMTYGQGVGAASDLLAGRVARASLTAFRG